MTLKDISFFVDFNFHCEALFKLTQNGNKKDNTVYFHFFHSHMFAVWHIWR